MPSELASRTRTTPCTTRARPQPQYRFRRAEGAARPAGPSVYACMKAIGWAQTWRA